MQNCDERGGIRFFEKIGERGGDDTPIQTMICSFKIVTLAISSNRGRQRCCRRPQYKQICLPQNTDFYKTVPKAADFIFARAVDL